MTRTEYRHVDGQRRRERRSWRGYNQQFEPRGVGEPFARADFEQT